MRHIMNLYQTRRKSENMWLHFFVASVLVLLIPLTEGFHLALSARTIASLPPQPSDLVQRLPEHSSNRVMERTRWARMSVSSAEQARSAPSCTDRKIFLAKAVRAVAGVGVTAGVLAAPHQAGAEEETPPVDWNSEFGLVRTGMKKVLEDLRGQLAGEDWKEVMNTARNYDISFRKEKMGKLRKKLPKVPKGLKGDALTFTNDVAYDLIAINKAARVEDKARGLEVCDILEGDVNSFLSLEKRL
ncbi:unnamed protein product [Ascophyllum nodosum]